MLCEHCHKHEATIHVSQTIDGQSQEQHFCGGCARELGLNQPFKSYLDEWMKPGLTGQSIFDTAGGIPAFGSPVTRSMVCPSCGQRYDDFRRSGLLGCSNCYVAFGDRLDAIFRRVQGGTRHIGRKACETADQQELQLYRHQLVELRQQLQQAVEDEAYEMAASLRDRVHALQKTIETMERSHTTSNCRTAIAPNLPSEHEAEGGDDK